MGLRLEHRFNIASSNPPAFLQWQQILYRMDEGYSTSGCRYRQRLNVKSEI